jgi:hypothetical protein
MTYRTVCRVWIVITLAAPIIRSAPPPDDAYPPPAEEMTTSEKQAHVIRYLVKKTDGVAAPIQLPRVNADMVCLKQYETLEKANQPAGIYSLMLTHLKISGQRLRAKDQEDMFEGMDIALQVGLQAVKDHRDPWLAAHVADAFILPYIEFATRDATKARSQMEYIQYVRVIFREADDRKRSIQACRRYLEIAKEHTDNAADSARVHLAVALEKDGQLHEALEVLRAIDPKGSLSGSQADLIARVTKEIAQRKADAPPKK